MPTPPATEGSAGAGKQAALLNKIYELIQGAKTLEDVIFEIEQLILDLVQGERLTVYRRQSQDLVSLFQSSGELEEAIRVPIGPSSISGYVAMSNSPIKIDDVYNTDELAAIHPKLAFDYSFDQNSGFTTEAMIVVPILFKAVGLGVIQVINRRGGGPFADQDVIHAIAIGQLIGEKFRFDLRVGTGPFESLIRQGLVTIDRFEELEAEAKAKGLPLTLLLRRQEKVALPEIGKALETFYQAPFMAYDETFQPDPQLLETLNPSYLATNNWVPFRSASGSLIVLIDDPHNADRIMEIQQLAGDVKVELRVGTKEDILRYLGYAFPEDVERQDDNLEAYLGKLEAKIDVQSVSSEDEVYTENTSAIVSLVNQIIIQAVTAGASDIHVEPAHGRSPGRARMRIDGECLKQFDIPFTYMPAVISRIKVLSKNDISEHRRPQHGKIRVRMEGTLQELRVAIMPTINGESAVLRVLASGGRAMAMNALNLTQRNHDKILECLEHTHGIFLCVGPTGSGKTTTLHALLGQVNTEDVKILTAEDPVEITQPRLQQVQVEAKIGVTFAAALKSFLRADPDIILVGEMRDTETAQIGVEASLTGHLVFSTLHTNSAPETLVRLLDMGLDPMNFADAMIGVLSQRLVRTLCSRCKHEDQPTAEELERLIHVYGEAEFAAHGLRPADVKLWRPGRCEHCANTGYKGRTGLHELLVASPEMRMLIARKGNVHELRKLAVEQNMRTLQQDGVLKIFKGDTDLLQLRKVTVE